MAVEIPFFNIGRWYGGNQGRMIDLKMRIGGCGALTACDSCICFAKHMGMPELYPYDADNLKKTDYLRFAALMKKYLPPRMSGINRVDIYIDELQFYLQDRGCTGIGMEALDGHVTWQVAAQKIKEQITAGMPVPCLTLYHKDPAMEDYVYHWFILAGFEERDDTFMVKAVTYGEYEWISLERLWNTGYEERGGLVLYSKIRG